MADFDKIKSKIKDAAQGERDHRDLYSQEILVDHELSEDIRDTMTEEERKDITEALKRYCELDTLAMVMIYEHLKSLIFK